jgi:hypothetical protein
MSKTTILGGIISPFSTIAKGGEFVLDKTVGALFRIAEERQARNASDGNGEAQGDGFSEQAEYGRRKQHLLDMLEILKTGRGELISDILVQRRYDFKVFFKYEDNPRVLSIAFTQYFVEWINALVKIAFYTSKELGVRMVQCLSPIVEERLNINASDIQTIDTMLPQLFEEKINALKAFLKVEGISEEKLNKLDFTIERENALFNRLWKSIEKGE